NHFSMASAVSLAGAANKQVAGFDPLTHFRGLRLHHEPRKVVKAFERTSRRAPATGAASDPIAVGWLARPPRSMTPDRPARAARASKPAAATILPLRRFGWACCHV